jgi:hypothetical protein
VIRRLREAIEQPPTAFRRPSGQEPSVVLEMLDLLLKHVPRDDVLRRADKNGLVRPLSPPCRHLVIINIIIIIIIIIIITIIIIIKWG